jgi:hypothetical protein
MNADAIINEKRAMSDELRGKRPFIRYLLLVVDSFVFDLIGVHRRPSAVPHYF